MKVPWKRKVELPVIPLQLEEPKPWTADDAAVLQNFLKGPVGQKLQGILFHELYDRCLATERKDDFKQGVDAGKNMLLGRILHLGEFEMWKEIAAYGE